MTEIEKIEYAKMFIDKMAQGINPLNNQTIHESDLLNHIRISRCLFYVSNILGEVIMEKKNPKHKSDLQKLEYHMLKLDQFQPSEFALSISHFVSNLKIIYPEGVQTIPRTTFTGWLTSQGFLEVIENENGKKQSLPTPQGYHLGIMTQERVNRYGVTYTGVLYAKSAQQFLIDHLEQIIIYMYQEKKE